MCDVLSFVRARIDVILSRTSVFLSLSVIDRNVIRFEESADSAIHLRPVQTSHYYSLQSYIKSSPQVTITKDLAASRVLESSCRSTSSTLSRKVDTLQSFSQAVFSSICAFVFEAVKALHLLAFYVGFNIGSSKCLDAGEARSPR
mmetsp:Transcript_7970/g.21121  ORF Transcript_7970/g.21121 Transcript_7970/m.21121 type:complete len:145 (+) Transcript_7970:550-984(+)